MGPTGREHGLAAEAALDGSRLIVPGSDGAAAFPLSQIQRDQKTALLQRVAAGTYRWEDVPACLCGGTGALTLSHKDRFGIPVGTKVCDTCGLVRRTPRLAAADLPQFYERDYHALHMGIVAPDPSTVLVRAGQGAAIYSYMRDLLNDATVSVVEIGAGNGGVLREFAAAAKADGRTATLVGCEYSSAFVEVARSLGTDVRHGGVETLNAIAVPDVLILSHVLEHFANPLTELARLKGLIGPATLVYVEVPGLLTLHKKEQYEFDLLHFITLAHTYDFTLTTLRCTLARVGLGLVRGDEEVRSVFRVREPDPAVRQLADHSAQELVDYLAHVEHSRTLRQRRKWIRWRRAARPRMRKAMAALLGERRAASLRERIRATRS